MFFWYGEVNGEIERGQKMLKKEESCTLCGEKLGERETDASIILVCENGKCENYWTNKDCEILMVLK